MWIIVLSDDGSWCRRWDAAIVRRCARKWQHSPTQLSVVRHPRRSHWRLLRRRPQQRPCPASRLRTAPHRRCCRQPERSAVKTVSCRGKIAHCSLQLRRRLHSDIKTQFWLLELFSGSTDIYITGTGKTLSVKSGGARNFYLGGLGNGSPLVGSRDEAPVVGLGTKYTRRWSSLNTWFTNCDCRNDKNVNILAQKIMPQIDPWFANSLFLYLTGS